MVTSTAPILLPLLSLFHVRGEQHGARRQYRALRVSVLPVLVGKSLNEHDSPLRELVGPACHGRLENGVRDFNYKSHGPPEKLNGNLYGAGFLSVDSPGLVNYLGGGGCELVAFRYVLACADELVETAGLAFHCAGILAPGGVPPPILRFFDSAVLLEFLSALNEMASGFRQSGDFQNHSQEVEDVV
jgi:hypothetical protein